MIPIAADRGCLVAILDVDPRPVVFAGVQLRVVGPILGGQKGAVDEEGGVLRDLLQGRDAAGESICEDCCHSVDGWADGRLGHATAFSKLGLDSVTA